MNTIEEMDRHYYSWRKAIILVLLALFAGLAFGYWQKSNVEAFARECTENGGTIVESIGTRGRSQSCLPAGR